MKTLVQRLRLRRQPIAWVAVFYAALVFLMYVVVGDIARLVH